MAGLGFEGVGGLQGGYGAFEKMLADRIAAIQYADKMRQMEIQNAQRDRQLGQGDRRMDIDTEQFGARMGLDQAQLEQAKHAAERPYVVGEGQELVSPSGGVLHTGRPRTTQAQVASERPFVVGGNLVTPQGGVIFSAPKEVKAAEKDTISEYEAKKKIDAKYMGGRQSLGTERSALGYFNRMLEAERNARAVEDSVGNRDMLASELPMVPGFVENWLKSPKGQQYTQAQRMFTEARLRKESGAAIPEGEFANDRRMNFRASGDTPDVVRQKRASRLNTMRGIGNAAGRALQEFYGDSMTLDDLLREFGDVSASTGPTSADGLNVPSQNDPLGILR